jgi:hypothetical protein
VVLVRRDLGSDGIAYVSSYLEASREFGRQLGPLLQASHDVDAGISWAFVPSPLPAARTAPLADFETGGLFSTRDPTWPKALLSWLDSVRGVDAHFVCVEGALERPSDPFLESLDQPVFFCGDSVFYYALLSPDEMPEWWFGGATWRPDVTVITPVPAKLPAHRDEIDQSDLAQLAANAVAVVIGAWDDEGLIFWQPQPTG